MNSPTAAPPASMNEHPAPHRGRISLWSMWLGIFLAPAGWFVQLLVDTFAISQGCFPKDHLLESGDGRTRFMSMSGMLVSGMVLLAVIYSGISHFALTGCGQ
jgi:hypothetical protein